MSTGPGRFATIGSAWLFTLVGACGAATPPTARTSDRKSPSPADELSHQPCARERARAAELAQAAEAVAPPMVPSFDDKGDSLAFIRGPVAEWLKARRAAVDQADEASAAALACMPSREQGHLLLERARLQGQFATTFLRVAEAAMPSQFLADPELKRAMLGSLVDAVQPQLERARGHFQACLALGDQSAPADVKACSTELAQLPPPPVQPTPSAESAAQETKWPRLDTTRPFIATSQPQPCAFAGTLKLWRPVVSIGTREVARIEHVEISRLTLPSARSGSLVIETAWPIRGTFALPASTLPFNLRSRVELVRGHVWLSEGAAVSAAAVPGGALVYRPVNAGAEIKPDPAVQVACSELELAGRVEPTYDDTKRARVWFKGPLTLADSPGGAPIANLTLNEPETFVLLGRKNEWRHIQSLSTPFRGFDQPLPYDFDAWTQSPVTHETSFGMIGLLPAGAAPTHSSTAALTLYADPSGTQPVGKLVKDVPLLLGDTRGRFVNVIVPGMDAVEPERAGFWAEKSAANAAVRAR